MDFWLRSEDNLTTRSKTCKNFGFRERWVYRVRIKYRNTQFSFPKLKL